MAYSASFGKTGFGTPVTFGKKSSSHSNFFANLFKDVTDTATHLPSGLYHLATTNPIDTAKDIYKVEKAQWSPLLTGDYHKWAHNFYEHPLAPILDVATVVTGGAGAAVRVGKLASEGSKIAEWANRVHPVDLLPNRVKDLSRAEQETLNKAVPEGERAIKYLSNNPVVRARQRVFHEVTKKLPSSVRYIGETAQAARALKSLRETGSAKDRLVADRYAIKSKQMADPSVHLAYTHVLDSISPTKHLSKIEQVNGDQIAKYSNEIASLTAHHSDLKKQIKQTQAAFDQAVNHEVRLERTFASGAKVKGQLTSASRSRTRLNKRLDALKSELHNDHVHIGEYDEAMKAHRDYIETSRKVLENPKASKYFEDAIHGYNVLKEHGLDHEVESERRTVAQAIRAAKAADPSFTIEKNARRILETREAAHDVVKRGAEIRQLDPVQALTRTYEHRLLHRGAEFLPTDTFGEWNKGDRTRLVRVTKEHKDGSVTIETIGKRGATGKTFKLSQKEAAAKLKLAAHPGEAEGLLNTHAPLHAPDVARAMWHPEHSIDELIKQEKHLLNQLGLPEPVYFPDKMHLDVRNSGQRALKTTRKTGMVSKQSLGVLYQIGALQHDPFLLGKQFVGEMQFAHAQDIARTLHAHAHKARDTGPIPKGYVALNIDHGSDFLKKSYGDFKKEIQKQTEAGDTNGVRKLLDSHLLEGKGPLGDGERLLVNRQLYDSLVEEFSKGTHFANAFYRKPTTIWKHAVLAGRPLPFIANNVIGNTLMYALRHGGIGGARGIANALGTGSEKVFEDFFAPAHLTFGQFHKFERTSGKLGKLQASLNFAYNTVSTHEHFLRRSSMERTLMTNPAVQKELRAFKAAHPDWKAIEHDGRSQLYMAVEKTFEKHPGLQEHVTKEIDNVLGNYRNFTQGEQLLRDIAPFYSWNRHAARWALNLLSEKPGTVRALNYTGQKGVEENQSAFGDVPDFLAGYIPTGVPGLGSRGKKTAINLSSINPLQTVSDEVKIVQGLLTNQKVGAPELASSLNPIFSTILEGITKTDLRTGAPVKRNFLSGGGLIGQGLAHVAEGLPEVRLGAALVGTDNRPSGPQYTPTGRLKKEHVQTIEQSFRDQVLGYLSMPVKHVDVTAAQQWQAKIDKTPVAKAQSAAIFTTFKKKKRGGFHFDFSTKQSAIGR